MQWKLRIWTISDTCHLISMPLNLNTQQHWIFVLFYQKAFNCQDTGFQFSLPGKNFSILCAAIILEAQTISCKQEVECFPVGAVAALANILPRAIREEQAHWPKALSGFRRRHIAPCSVFPALSVQTINLPLSMREISVPDTFFHLLLHLSHISLQCLFVTTVSFNLPIRPQYNLPTLLRKIPVV